MLKLYKFTEKEKLYWETWEDNKTHTVHWGVLGTEGESENFKSSFFNNQKSKIQSFVDQKITEGYDEINIEDHSILIIEYKIDGMGNDKDLKKRQDLEDRMNETLGWTGLGDCDGGSIGSGTMEVCCFVVDFNLAKQIIENDLKDTDFSDYTRIYDERDEG